MTVTTRAAAQRSVSPQTDNALSTASPRQPSPTKTNESLSEGEGRIRPTRRRLAKTSINAREVSTKVEASEDLVAVGGVKTFTNGSRGRGVQRKRSFEELGAEQEESITTKSTQKHSRKRSKEMNERERRHESASTVSNSEDSNVAHSGDEQTTAMSVASPLNTNAAAHEEVEPTTPPRPMEDGVQVTIDVKKSPPSKRNRDQFDQDSADHSFSGEASGVEVTATTEENATQPKSIPKPANEVPESKRQRDSFLGPASKDVAKDDITKISPSSGFANFSAKSPFATLSPNSATSQPQASSSAFASSGFAALAGSSQSAFGSLGSQSVLSKAKESTTPSAFASIPPSGFATLGAVSKTPFAASSSSVFGGSVSGFGQLSNGLGSASASGTSFGGPLHKPLSSFASTGTPSNTLVEGKIAKPFGSLGDDEEEADASDGEEEGYPRAVGADEEHRDERFYEQEVETGEEGETVEFKGRGKLYMMGSDKQWRERGTGDFKVNSRRTDDKLTARFLMRVDGSHRIVLNSKIDKTITKIQDPQLGLPRGRTAVFLGSVDGQIVTFQLKMRDNVQTLALHDAVKKVQKSM